MFDSHGREITHVVLTRFNLATPGREEQLRNRTGWLEQRFALFERFCLPSIAQQSAKDFHWLIFFDDHTPQLFRDRIERDRRITPFTPIFTPMFETEGWARFVRENVRRRAWLLSTRLDNDDALAIDFCERLRKSITAHKSCALNFTNGCVLAQERIYAHRHHSNAFASLLEPFDDRTRTICSIPHMNLRHHVEVVQVDGPPAWLQVIHESNVSNKIRGFRISASDVETRFPAQALSDLKADGLSTLIENVTLWPARWLRDGVVTGARRILRKSQG